MFQNQERKVGQLSQRQSGDLVLVRKSGMKEKLSQSWAGPFPICKMNSPLSYQVDSRNKRPSMSYAFFLLPHCPVGGRVML